MPCGGANGKRGSALEGLLGLRTLPRMGTKKAMRRGVEHADRGQQQHTREPLQRIGQPESQQPEESIMRERPPANE